MKRIFCLAVLSAVASSLHAMPIKTEMMKSKAYFQEAEGGLLEPLDLKSKTMSLTKADFDQCGLNLMREASTLNYSCTLPIPTQARISKLQNIITARMIEVDFGGAKRKVFVNVTADARSMTLSTGFDATGIDFEVSKFNDDFFNVYNKFAQIVIIEAMGKQPVRIQVLEGGENKADPGPKKIKAIVKAGS
jgi:hypothetical protein